MTKTFISKIAHNKLEKIKDVSPIMKAIRELSEGKLIKIKKIIGTNLYSKRAGNHRIIFSKENSNFLIVEILTRKELLNELRGVMDY